MNSKIHVAPLRIEIKIPAKNILRQAPVTMYLTCIITLNLFLGLIMGVKIMFTADAVADLF